MSIHQSTRVDSLDRYGTVFDNPQTLTDRSLLQIDRQL